MEPLDIEPLAAGLSDIDPLDIDPPDCDCASAEPAIPKLIAKAKAVFPKIFIASSPQGSRDQRPGVPTCWNRFGGTSLVTASFIIAAHRHDGAARTGLDQYRRFEAGL